MSVSHSEGDWHTKDGTFAMGPVRRRYLLPVSDAQLWVFLPSRVTPLVRSAIC